MLPFLDGEGGNTNSPKTQPGPSQINFKQLGNVTNALMVDKEHKLCLYYSKRLDKVSSAIPSKI